MEKVEVGGVPAHTTWTFQGADGDSQGKQLTLRYRNLNPRLELRSIWKATAGRGPVEHWITILNQSENVVTVTHQDSLSLEGLTLAPNESAQARWVNRGGSNAALEGGTFTADMNSELDQVLVSSPVDGSSPVPWMAIQVGQARGLYVGWEFSGVGRIHIAAQPAKPLRFDWRVGLIPEFKTDVLAGETFLVPRAFVGCYRGDIDDGTYTLHRFVLDKLLPPLPQDQPYPTLAYNLYLDHATSKTTTAQAPELIKEADVLRSAALARELGFETFVPDAMWFPQSGDWRWDPARFPRGEQPIEEYVHQNGMKMGLWCAWTHGAISDSPEALGIWQHPEWFVRKPQTDVKPEYLNWGKLIDLSCSPAKEWVERKLCELVSTYKLDYLKHDYSPIVTTCEGTNHRHKYGVDVSYWSTLAYYEVQEMLKQKFPALVLEGCSGGGHIKDFGYIRHVHYIVTTDTLADLPDRQSIYESTFALPPAILMAYTYDNQYQGQFVPEANRPEPFLWRSAMMGAWQIDPTDSATWTAEERARLKRSTEVYKTWIRPILGNAQVHHILPRPDGYHWDGMFYWNPSLKRGIVYVFRPNNDEAFQRIRLKGLAASAHYRIWSEDASVAEGVRAGAELMNAGLRVKLPGKFTSDLIYLKSE